jgi:hypothetical protein
MGTGRTTDGRISRCRIATAMIRFTGSAVQQSPEREAPVTRGSQQRSRGGLRSLPHSARAACPGRHTVRNSTSRPHHCADRTSSRTAGRPRSFSPSETGPRTGGNRTCPHAPSKGGTPSCTTDRSLTQATGSSPTCAADRPPNPTAVGRVRNSAANSIWPHLSTAGEIPSRTTDRPWAAPALYSYSPSRTPMATKNPAIRGASLTAGSKRPSVCEHRRGLQ